MKLLKAWMMIVGALYLMEGIGLMALARLAPDEFAAIWATTSPASLDEIAVRGIMVAGLPGVLTWVMLGSMLWFYAREPRSARLLILIVISWELLVWLPLDVIGFFNGFDAGRAAVLSLIHAILGVSGILALRRLPRAG